MPQEPLYKRVPQEGKHPAKSKRIPGAISGAALDDKTNKPSGASDFVPVGMTEEDYIRTQRKVAFWGGLAQIGIDYASARIQEWWCYTALPKLHYEIIPAGKEKAVKLYRRVIKQKKQINPEDVEHDTLVQSITKSRERAS